MATPLHIDHTLAVKISRDVAGTQLVLKRDERVTFDQYREGGTSVFSVAAGATDASLPMLNIADAQFIYMEADGAITVKFNGAGNTAITLRPNPAVGAVGKMVLETSGISSIFVSNAGSESVRLLYALAGD